MWKACAGAKWNPHRARLEAVQWRVIGMVVAQAEEELSKAFPLPLLWAPIITAANIQVE
jgi:hypothetical protein